MRDAVDLDALAAVIAKNSSVLDATVKGFPKAFTTFDVVTQSGNWLNAYPCAVSVAVSGTPTATPAQIAALVADYLGGGNAVVTSVLDLIGGLFPKGAGLPVPLNIPTGPSATRARIGGVPMKGCSERDQAVVAIVGR